MKFPFCICLFPLVFALFHPALAEGNNGSLDFEQRINGKAVLKTIEPIRERLQDLSAVFFSGHDVVIYGIVLSPDGYIGHQSLGTPFLQGSDHPGRFFQIWAVQGNWLGPVHRHRSSESGSRRAARSRPRQQ